MLASASPAAWRPKFRWHIWLSWIAASTAAIMLGFVLLYALIFAAKAIVPGVNEDHLMGWVLFPILGTALGIGQWIMLRGRLPRVGWWIPATTEGWIVVMAAGALITRVLGVAPGNESAAAITALLSTLVVGLSLGVLQLPILYRHIRWPPLWIAASAAGWLTLGFAIGKSIDRTPDILALGALPAAFTGLALAWLWRDHAPSSSRQTD